MLGGRLNRVDDALPKGGRPALTAAEAAEPYAGLHGLSRMVNPLNICGRRRMPGIEAGCDLCHNRQSVGE